MKKKLFNLIIAIVAIIGLNQGIFSQDNIPASTNPPGGMNPQQVPMLVAFGWDDNAMEDAMLWITDFMRDRVNPSQNGNPLTFDGLPARHTFFNVGAAWLDTAWSIAFNDGHEIGNHTLFHNGQYPMFDGSPSGTLNSASDWENDILVLNDSLTNWINKYNTDMGINNVFKKEYVRGFRTPRLEFTEATYEGMVAAGMLYDCSIEHSSNGSNSVWPYTLNSGPHSTAKKYCGSYSGLWEFAVHDIDGMTGFDYNFFAVGNNGAAYCQWLAGDFDARYSGNRSPMLVNAHTDNFSPEKFPQQAEERQGGVEDFINYVLSKPDVRMVRYIDVIQWMRYPVVLGATWIDENQAMHGTPFSAKLSIDAVTRNSMQLTLPESGFYSVSIYAPNGQLIKTVKAGYFNAGTTSISWNRSAMANGIYLVRLQGLRGSIVKRISTSNLGL